jgi:hypothetical protein
MKIVKVEHFPNEQLIAQLREITMLKNSEAYPYKEADINLVYIHTNDLAPAQRYVLNSELQKVRELEWQLEGFGYSSFKLNGFVKIWIEGYDEPIDVLPPIVEKSPEADGKIVNIINDGMHRVFNARLSWVVPQVVIVDNIPGEYPYYAFPTPNGWNDVEIIDELKNGFVKKWHRIPNHHSLYRNFNSAFQNVGGPRPVTK